MPPLPLVEPAPSSEQMAELADLLAAVERPLVIVGGSGWTTDAFNLVAFAEAFELPIAAAFHCQDRMDNAHRLYVGEVGTSVTPELAERVRTADILIAWATGSAK